VSENGPETRGKQVIRDRIVKLVRVPANELQAHPKNYRLHSGTQLDAIKATLSEIGFAGAELGRELPSGQIQIIDGHARARVAGESVVPVLILDLNDSETDKLLATYDPIGAMADTNRDLLASLTENLDTNSAEFDSLIADIRAQHGLNELDHQTKIRELEVKPLPNLTWVLVGIPTIRYGEIASMVEKITELPDTFVELCVNDGELPSALS
jgi:ParB-like chromosome segregation protein Spo0J